MTTFALRIDIDTKRGLIEGTPNILKVLCNYESKAPFYIPIGGESGIFDVIKYREVEFERGAKIIKSVHELGVHGWKHGAWTRKLEKINIEKHFDRMVKKYEDLSGKKPSSFAAYGFKINNQVLTSLDKFGFKVASDLIGRIPFHPITDKKKLVHLQVPITIRKGNLPIIEKLRDEIKKHEFAVIYWHAVLKCTENRNN